VPQSNIEGRIVSRRATASVKRAFWIGFARWLVAALTFLSYFVDRDLE
jgi:hypothetical protein